MTHSSNTAAWQQTCDVLVVGSGAAGFSAAITARTAGLDVLMVEKSGCFGGTSAVSGGYIWIPGNRLAQAAGIQDPPEEIRAYLRDEIGNRYDTDLIEAYLTHGPDMVDFLIQKVGVNYHLASHLPDYHSERPHASRGGRALYVHPVNGAILGEEFRRLRPLPRELSLFGMGVSSGSDLSHLYYVGRSLKSTWRVAVLLARYALDMMRFGRSRTLVNGNSLIAQLARGAFRLGIPLWTFSPATDLIVEDGYVTGAIIVRNGQPIRVHARKGVVLASGGFAHDVERRRKVYTHPARAEEHVSLTAPGNAGDGARMAESVGGFVDETALNAGAWMPISRVPRPDGSWGPILHSVNLGKPGVIAVLRDGKRFVDESVSYHDFVEKMIAMPQAGCPAGAFIICDHRAFSQYGLGYAKPFLPLKSLLANGYLHMGDTPGALAESAGIDPQALTATIADFNRHAVIGKDPLFGKGTSAYGRFLGDLQRAPNPCVAPIDRPPYYAVWMYPGDIGNFAGIKTDASGRVLRRDGRAVPGLFAVGNDMSSVFRGTYPGGGALLGPGLTFGYIVGKALAADK